MVKNKFKKKIILFFSKKELLDRSEFTHVEKIKTIGPCYMAASGLNPDRRRLSLHPYEHLYQANFIFCLSQTLPHFLKCFFCKLLISTSAS